MKITRPKFVRTPSILCEVLEKQIAGRRFVLLTDETVSRHCLPYLSLFLDKNKPLDIVEVESGEDCKAPEVVMQLWSHALELGLSKSDVLLCLGGGSISDLGGFFAATYKRGISCVFIPTTLLAMTDAAVGGKNGVDVGSVKNAVGTITQPESILVYPGFCDSLPSRQFRSGMAEIIKHSFIEGSIDWEDEIDRAFKSGEVSLNLLRKSAKVKLGLVRRDVYDSGIRRVLNFGHTMGHAIESVYLINQTPIEHGYAVAAGMLAECHAGLIRGIIKQEVFEALKQLYSKWYAHDVQLLPEWNQLESFLWQDKKGDSEKILLFLPTPQNNFVKIVITDSNSLEVSYNQLVELIF